MCYTNPHTLLFYGEMELVAVCLKMSVCKGIKTAVNHAINRVKHSLWTWRNEASSCLSKDECM